MYVYMYVGVEESGGEVDNFVVSMQRQEFSIRGSLQDSIDRAILLMSVYLPLFTSLSFMLPTLDEVLAYFHSCKREFARGVLSRVRMNMLSLLRVSQHHC